MHGEQYIELHRPIPSSGEIHSKTQLIDMLDKGSGTLVIVGVESADASGQPLFYNQIAVFLVGTNAGGSKRSDKPEIKNIVPIPDREPDAIVSEKTQVSQVFILC